MSLSLAYSNAAHRIQYIPGVQTPVEDAFLPPSALSVTGTFKAVVIAWAPLQADEYDLIEVFAATTNNRTNAIQIAELRGSYVVHSVPDNTPHYYWVRARKAGKVSAFNPASATGGLLGTPGGTVGSGDIESGAVAFTVEQTPVDGSLTYGSIAAGGSAFFDSNAIATVALTNTLSQPISAVISYKSTVCLAASEPSGVGHFLYMDVAGSATYTENTVGVSFSTFVTPNRYVRSGTKTLTVPAGGSIIATSRVGVRVNAFITATPATVQYSDVSISIIGVV